MYLGGTELADDATETEKVLGLVSPLPRAKDNSTSSLGGEEPEQRMDFILLLCCPSGYAKETTAASGMFLLKCTNS